MNKQLKKFRTSFERLFKDLTDSKRARPRAGLHTWSRQ